MKHFSSKPHKPDTKPSQKEPDTFFQKKLDLGQPGDGYELETNNKTRSKSPTNSIIQEKRKMENEEAPSHYEKKQTENIQSHIEGRRQGNSLQASIKKGIESGFAADFSQVRIHSGSQSRDAVQVNRKQVPDIQKDDDSPYFTGTVIIGQGCRLEDFRIIPGNPGPLYTPTSRVVTHIDGFWYRQRSDAWFKIPNGATVSITCDENRRLSYRTIVNVPFYAPGWERGSGYPF